MSEEANARGSPASPALQDSWAALRQLTTARIGLPRSGASLATQPLLELRLAHARARDAVHHPLDEPRLIAALGGLGPPVLAAASAVRDRREYLMRPDLGRRLDARSHAMLAAQAGSYGLAVVIADGLSAAAVEAHAPAVLAAALPALASRHCRVAPLVIVRQGRVAIGDHVAAALGATAVAVLIGERPGLSSPDSMGLYMTWRPHPGSTDADRNCISNIRPEGTAPGAAAAKMVHLLDQMRRCGFSGVRLKESPAAGQVIAGSS
ncbi:MAG: ethanolamine ammonia-lyase subunit EutC [Xanthobacteraceae bacterium]|jgi:ethanolamine ammonia-lyase small subunit